MSTKTIIPAGYRVTVTTWENDGDNHNTAVVEGVSQEAAKFIVELCKIHYSENAQWGISGYGNMYDPSEEKIDEYHKALQQLIDTHANGLPTPWCDSVDGVQEYAYDLHLTGGEFFTRVCDDIKVEYVPAEIQLDDVTAEFI